MCPAVRKPESTRGHHVPLIRRLQKSFTEAFEVVRITGFWPAYESLCAEDRQHYLVHLLRELRSIDLTNDSEQWCLLLRRLRRLLRNGMRLRPARTCA